MTSSGSPRSTKIVSKLPRAGCQSGMLSASKLYQGLDLGALGYLEPHSDKDILEPVAGLGDQVIVAAFDLVSELGEIEAFGFELGHPSRLGQLGSASVAHILDSGPGGVQELAEFLALLGFEPAQLLLECGEAPLLAEHFGLCSGQRFERVGAAKCGLSGRLKIGERLLIEFSHKLGFRVPITVGHGTAVAWAISPGFVAGTPHRPAASRPSRH